MQVNHTVQVNPGNVFHLVASFVSKNPEHEGRKLITILGEEDGVWFVLVHCDDKGEEWENEVFDTRADAQVFFDKFLEVNA